MSSEDLQFVYSTHQIANTLSIGRSTVNKYARSLEVAGYVYLKDDKERRSFTEHDIIAFRALLELLARGVEYDSAVKSVVERYKPLSKSDSVALVATPDSSTEVATLGAKVDDLIQVVARLSNKIDEIVDDRVRTEIAAATSVIEGQVNQVFEEIRAAQERTEKKLEDLGSRIEHHGKRKKFLGLF